MKYVFNCILSLGLWRQNVWVQVLILPLLALYLWQVADPLLVSETTVGCCEFMQVRHLARVSMLNVRSGDSNTSGPDQSYCSLCAL